MATFTSAAAIIPSFNTGLKSVIKSPSTTTVGAMRAPASSFRAKASLRDAAATVAVAAAASAMLASSALAAEVLLGGDDGSLAFVPSTFSVDSGETIVFKNNAGFPHNVVFDEDGVPAGVDAAKISMPEEDLLNAPSETYKVTLTEKGSYTFYCSPHQGAGMVGKVTVN